jgi:hypothetical protein
MKNRIGIAETCLYLMSIFAFFGVVFALLNYGSLTNSLYNPGHSNVSFIKAVVIPSTLGIFFGLTFHFCAKFIKRGNSTAWKVSILLLIANVLISLPGILLGQFVGILGLVVSCVGIWALLQKGTRQFIFHEQTAS